MLDRLYELREIAKADKEPVLRDKSFELLLKTVKEANPKRILEIGTNRGLSGIGMLLSCENATLTSIEIDEDKARLAKGNYKEFNLENRAKIFLGDAGEVLPTLTGTYDFIFLDGPKGHYGEYLPHLLTALEVGGTLFADNVLFRGYVLGTVKTPHRFNTTKHSMQNFLHGVSNSPDLKTTVYDIEDGVSITKKLK